MLSAIQAQLAVITKQLGATTVNSIQTNSFVIFMEEGMKAILMNLVVLPSNKLSKQIILITIKGRTTPSPIHTV